MTPLAIALDLAGLFDEVRVVHLSEKGRGGALKTVWGRRRRRCLLTWMSTYRPTKRRFSHWSQPLISGHSDLAIGTRLARGARVTRGPKREFVSRSYNLLLRGTLGARFSDAQCGFKGDPLRCGGAVVAVGGGHGLVLRHRVARTRPAGGVGSTRSPSIGSMIQTPGWISSPQRRQT